MARKSQRIACRGHKRNGDPCPNWAMHGQMVCAAHGGQSPQAKAAAKRRMSEAAAREAVRKFTFEPVGNPLTALAEVAGELVAVKDFLRGETERLQQIASTSFEGTEQLKAEFAAYQVALRDTVSTLAVIARLNIDERLVAIEQQKADMIASAISSALADLGIDSETQNAAKVGLVRRLRIAAGT